MQSTSFCLTSLSANFMTAHHGLYRLGHCPNWWGHISTIVRGQSTNIKSLMVQLSKWNESCIHIVKINAYQTIRSIWFCQALNPGQEASLKAGTFYHCAQIVLWYTAISSGNQASRLYRLLSPEISLEADFRDSHAGFLTFSHVYCHKCLWATLREHHQHRFWFLRE